MALEFTKLSQLTGDPKFYDAVQRIHNVMEAEQKSTKLPQLWPVVFNAQTQSFKDDNLFTLGGRSDSMYEYVPKQYMLLGTKPDQNRRMYESYLSAAQEHLFFRPMNPDNLDILISGSARVENGEINLNPTGEHLSCFVAGLVALGSKVFERPNDLEVAKKLVNGCLWASESTGSGIMPEVFTVIPPTRKSGAKNKWDVHRWYDAVNAAVPAGSADEVKDKDARAQKIVEMLHLPLGIPIVNDKRYILRYDIPRSTDRR
jgi:mannosyl-oligosaccharide alpha-1,2-mannosidase